MSKMISDVFLKPILVILEALGHPLFRNFCHHTLLVLYTINLIIGLYCSDKDCQFSPIFSHKSVTMIHVLQAVIYRSSVKHRNRRLPEPRLKIPAILLKKTPTFRQNLTIAHAH